MNKKGFARILILISLLLLVFVGFFLGSKILQSGLITSRSMEPSCPSGSKYLAERLTYRYSSPKRFDIVLYQPNPSQNIIFLARIIGLPGEKLKIENGKIFVDNNILNEPYLTTDGANLGINYLREGSLFLVSENSYVLMIDKFRSVGADSIPIMPRSAIFAKVITCKR